MSDINLERVSPHDDAECAEGMARLRRERDSARDWAVEYENDARRLEDKLAEALREIARLNARLALAGGAQEKLDLPADLDAPMAGQDEFDGWPV